MKTLLFGSAALVLFAVSATAQNTNAPIQPNELTTTAKAKPPLQLSDEQRRKIQDALVTAHSAQKAPDNFEAKIGTKVPTKLKLDAMPAPPINEEPILKQYDFVKLENELCGQPNGQQRRRGDPAQIPERSGNAGECTQWPDARSCFAGRRS